MINQQLSQQLDIYGRVALATPKTEGIKYAGSKLKILPYIVGILSELSGVKNVLDGFSGSTRVSQAFGRLGYNTTSSDISKWSEVFANCYLKSEKSDQFYQEIIDVFHLCCCLCCQYSFVFKLFYSFKTIHFSNAMHLA